MALFCGEPSNSARVPVATDAEPISRQGAQLCHRAVAQIPTNTGETLASTITKWDGPAGSLRKQFLFTFDGVDRCHLVVGQLDRGRFEIRLQVFTAARFGDCDYVVL